MASNEWTELAKALTEFNSTLGSIVADTTNTANAFQAVGGASSSMAGGGITNNPYVTTGGTSMPSGGFVTTSPNWTITPSFAPTFYDQNICPLGHVASEDEVEFVDGVIVSKCITCGQRMQVNRVAGGMSLLRVQTLLGKVMSMDGDTEQMEEFSLSEILGDFAELKERLETEEFALRQARKLIELASQVLSAKVSDE